MSDDKFQESFPEFEKEENNKEEIEPLLNFSDLTDDIEEAIQNQQQISPSAKIIKKKDIKTEFSGVDENLAEELLKEDYEEHKKKVFEPAFISKEQDTDEPEDYQQVLIRNFKDFLVLPRITGARPKKGSRNIIERKQIEEGEIAEISHKPPFEDISSGESSIIVNRNIDGEIESLEVYCKDGEKIIIRFDFGDDNNFNLDQ